MPPKIDNRRNKISAWLRINLVYFLLYVLVPTIWLLVGWFIVSRFYHLVTQGALCVPIRGTNLVDCGAFAYVKIGLVLLVEYWLTKLVWQIVKSTQL